MSRSKKSFPVCVVTGGSAGIGAAICRTFSDNGYQVVNLDIAAPVKPPFNDSHRTTSADELTSLPVDFVQCDVSVSSEVTQGIQQVLHDFGRIDVLISNAGCHLSATIEDTSEEAFDRVFAINVKGAIAATKAVLPIMKSQCDGVILYMASDQAIVAKSNSFAYNLTKCALASMAKTTAVDYAKYGIRSNAICPGTIETPLYHQAIDRYVKQSGEDESEVHQQEANLQPLGRLGQPEEVAALALFLASNSAKFITGSLQVIDGGYTAK